MIAKQCCLTFELSRVRRPQAVARQLERRVRPRSEMTHFNRLPTQAPWSRGIERGQQLVDKCLYREPNLLGECNTIASEFPAQKVPMGDRRAWCVRNWENHRSRLGELNAHLWVLDQSAVEHEVGKWSGLSDRSG